MTAERTAAWSMVDDLRGDLLEVSHEIHAHPELCYEEHYAHNLLTDHLRRRGFEVSAGAYGLGTAFVARTRRVPGPTFAVLCEYDALPGLGHACGHNVIAAAGLGAFLAAAAPIEGSGCNLTVIGTPAEEGGGGKVELLRRGAFAGVDVAMMIHPASEDLTAMNTLAFRELRATYSGRASHAAAAPWNGRNALDAAVLGYVAVGVLRQHIHSDERVHGIITDGGERPSIVPDHAATDWFVRSPSVDRLEDLDRRVVEGLRSGAAATGCECVIEHGDLPYLPMRDHETTLALFRENAAVVGRPLVTPAEARHPVTGSTDMGNVSQVVPSIHPMLACAEPGTPIHTVEFAQAAASPIADDAVIDGAKIMAATLLDLASTQLGTRRRRSVN